MAGMKTALGIIQLWFIHFAASFIKALGNVNVNIWNFTKIIAGRTKRPRGPHAACVFETPFVEGAFLALEI